MIEQYEPRHTNLIVPSAILHRHWAPACGQFADRLRRFLGAPPSVGVLPVGRCSAAIQLAAEWHLRRQPGTCFLVNERTYRTVVDAIVVAGGHWFTSADAALGTFNVRWGPTITVWDTISGVKPWLTRSGAWIYDCAHTAYPDMLKDVELKRGQFVCLSFYPTKPLGAMGGGALLCNYQDYYELRARAYPESDKPCIYSVMQSVQCWAVEQMMEWWDANWWEERRQRYVEVRKVVLDSFPGLHATYHGYYEPVTPHILSFVGAAAQVEELRTLMRQHKIETGYQYDYVNRFQVGPRPVAIPFHDPSILDVF